MLVDVTENVIGDDPVARLAENEADGRLVVFVTQLVVDNRAAKIRLAGEFRLKLAGLQFDDYEAAQAKMINEALR
jgi:hypothetical protein